MTVFDPVTVLLAEYEQVKQEQRARIGFRDNLIYATLAAMAAAVGSSLLRGGNWELLLLLPPVSIVLGWTYLANDEKISAAGRYVREDLAPRIEALAPERLTAFGWETAHRQDVHRRSRKRYQLGVDLLTFCIPPLAAIAVYAVQGTPRWPLLLVAGLEAVLVGGLARQIVRYADAGR